MKEKKDAELGKGNFKRAKRPSPWTERQIRDYLNSEEGKKDREELKKEIKRLYPDGKMKIKNSDGTEEEVPVNIKNVPIVTYAPVSLKSERQTEDFKKEEEKKKANNKSTEEDSFNQAQSDMTKDLKTFSCKVGRNPDNPNKENKEVFFALNYGKKRLYDLMMEERNLFEDYTLIAGMLRQLIMQLEGYHNEGLCHRDIKPENIMYQNGVCTLIDMLIKEGHCPVGTPNYMSRESFESDPVNFQNDSESDFWAILVYAIELCSGGLLFYHSDVKKILLDLDLNTISKMYEIVNNRKYPHQNNQPVYQAHYNLIACLVKELNDNGVVYYSIPEMIEKLKNYLPFGGKNEIFVNVSKENQKITDVEKYNIQESSYKEKANKRQKCDFNDRQVINNFQAIGLGGGGGMFGTQEMMTKQIWQGMSQQEKEKYATNHGGWDFLEGEYGNNVGNKTIKHIINTDIQSTDMQNKKSKLKYLGSDQKTVIMNRLPTKEELSKLSIAAHQKERNEAKLIYNNNNFSQNYQKSVKKPSKDQKKAIEEKIKIFYNKFFPDIQTYKTPQKFPQENEKIQKNQNQLVVKGAKLPPLNPQNKTKTKTTLQQSAVNKLATKRQQWCNGLRKI